MSEPPWASPSSKNMDASSSGWGTTASATVITPLPSTTSHTTCTPRLLAWGTDPSYASCTMMPPTGRARSAPRARRAATARPARPVPGGQRRPACTPGCRPDDAYLYERGWDDDLGSVEDGLLDG